MRARRDGRPEHAKGCWIIASERGRSNVQHTLTIDAEIESLDDAFERAPDHRRTLGEVDQLLIESPPRAEKSRKQVVAHPVSEIRA
jgi:hypothetical protein